MNFYEKLMEMFSIFATGEEVFLMDQKTIIINL